tara:strand:+ start:279 stop:503 length:225 start_codon:yes stop_codon:yes gene_type:complete
MKPEFLKFKYKDEGWIARRVCRITGVQHNLYVPVEDYDRYRGGLDPKEAFKYALKNDDMKLFITGYTKEEMSNA